MIQKPTWRFRRMGRAEPGIDPIQDEFFVTEELEDLNGALVREAIQNSLDAWAGEDPVEVVFTFGHLAKRRNVVEEDELFRGLTAHLKAEANGHVRFPQPVEALDFIAVEDFGTLGLQGDPEMYDDSAPDMAEQHFYYFWRNIGRSQKEKLRLGRWGLGKQVFPASSRINSFFGLTCRNNDHKTFFMGQAVLKVHNLGNAHRYFPYGWFGTFSDDEFPMPVEDSGYIRNFRETFGLRRTDEPGLSIVLPYPRIELDNKAIVRASILQYFHPILSGHLIVTVRFQEQKTRLTAETIRDAIEQHFPERSENFIGMIDFSEWAIRLPQEEYEILPEPDLTLTPNWSNVAIPADQQQNIRSRFEHDGRIALRIPVKVHKKGDKPVVSWFSLYLKRDDTLQAGEARFIREGINITHANPHLDRGLRGVVVIHDAALVSLLGDAEPPAHDKWNQQSRTLRDNYEKGSSTVGFVRKSLQTVYRRVLLSAEDKDVDLLRDLFYVDKSVFEPPDRKDRPGKKKGKKDTGGEVEPVESRPPLIRVQKLDEDTKGFTILPASEETPVSITVRVAYMIRRGSPLRNYHQYDFELGKGRIAIDQKNVRVTKCEQNELEAEIDDHDFAITVTGFDQNRDLFVKATPVRAASDTEV